MATVNYNELTHSAEYEVGSLDPMFYRVSRLPMRIEEAHPAHLPNRKSRLRSRRERNAARFKTQPITFDEIKEVDEEPEENKDAMRAQLLEFSKSMEMLVRTPSYRANRTAKSATSTAVAQTEVAGASAQGHHDASSSTSAHTSSNSSLDACTISATASRDRFRKRRKKRFHRSIEEVPDSLERDTKTDE